MRQNDWQRRFGAKRREIDRKLLAEVEIACGKVIPGPWKAYDGPPTSEADEAAAAIAKAFGRPLR